MGAELLVVIICLSWIYVSWFVRPEWLTPDIFKIGSLVVGFIGLILMILSSPAKKNRRRSSTPPSSYVHESGQHFVCPICGNYLLNLQAGETRKCSCGAIITASKIL